MQNDWQSIQTWTKHEYGRQISVKIHNIKFYENPP